MKPFIKYEDGSVEQSYLCHLFYIASLGFNIVPGMFTANGVPVNYESTQDGIRMIRGNGECLAIPFVAAMAFVSKPALADTKLECN